LGGLGGGDSISVEIEIEFDMGVALKNHNSHPDGVDWSEVNSLDGVADFSLQIKLAD
jgi:hypothetical protein